MLVLFLFSLLTSSNAHQLQCPHGQAITFSRWSGMSPDGAPPVFVYVASGEEESLSGACIARCRELDDCSGVAVAYGRGNCHGIAYTKELQLRADNDVSFFKKLCLKLPPASCDHRWWTVEGSIGYHLHSEDSKLKTLQNVTTQDCYDALLNQNRDYFYRSAQWNGPNISHESETLTLSDDTFGSCVLNIEDKFTEPESYRVSNYYTFYLENQCRHDYPEKIDRCSYEEYYNQTLKHVELTIKNFTKDECKSACEQENRFVCRGFTWIERNIGVRRGLCDLHSEDLVTAGSWLLRRTGPATYYRRVICLNISVDCVESALVVTYRPRGSFRGRMYVPGRGEQCNAYADNGIVRLNLPLYGDCDVNFAHSISHGPNGVINKTMAYVMVMIQNNPIIQTAGDRWVRVGCSPNTRSTTHVDAFVSVKDHGKPSQASQLSSEAIPAASSAVFNPNSAPLTMYVVRDRDDAEPPSGGAVALGEPLELRIETTNQNEIEAYHLVASSRMGESSVVLLDNRGCPTGKVDFPAFTRSFIGGTQRLSTKFKAFRFPTSHVVRFALMIRYCDGKCDTINCRSSQADRISRQLNETTYEWNEIGETPTIRETEPTGTWKGGVVAQGGSPNCGVTDDAVPLELKMMVDSRDILSADTLVRADHRSDTVAESTSGGSTLVCIHELLLVALALAWLAVQIVLLLGCCILVKRYRNLAEMGIQKDYQSFDNVGFDTLSTHRRVHWPDQNVEIMHVT